MTARRIWIADDEQDIRTMLSAYLRAEGFKTYIVSGGGLEFMRVMTEEVYGVPPEQVVGSSIVTQFELRDGEPVLVRLPQLDFIGATAEGVATGMPQVFLAITGGLALITVIVRAWRLRR